MDYTDDQLLAMAWLTLVNTSLTTHLNTLIEDDPRNEDDYDTWDYGTEPLPHDHTWQHSSIDIQSSEVQ
jgi:hypothetical protein